MTTYTRDAFVNHLIRQYPELVTAVLLVEQRTRLLAHASDEHAAHAMELIAGHKGIKTVRWHNVDAHGCTVIELSGFSQGGMR